MTFINYNNLLQILNQHYKLNLNDIVLHREMIGFVYFVRNDNKKYVLKIYRDFNTEQALQSVDIINFLYTNQYPVVKIIPTFNGNPFINIKTLKGLCIGVLYEFIEGIEPNIKQSITDLGYQIGILHQLMNKYPLSLKSHGKEFYIDRFIEMLAQIEYDSTKINDLREYGNELWNRIKKLPKGFCHGDLHSGNMIQDKSNTFILFDFDVASMAYSIIDVSTLSNTTNFNQFDQSTYDSTMKLFEEFYQGYSKVRTLSSAEVACLFDFIAVRHYELIATIIACEGLNGLNEPFVNQQYDWLMKWRNLCEQKRNRMT